MRKFAFYGTGFNVKPEDNGWVWCSETVSEPSPRRVFVKLACNDGAIDMSRVASGRLLYDDRKITVTFARFTRKVDGRQDAAETLATDIRALFENANNHLVSIMTKGYTANMYKAYAFDYSVSFDGRICFITFNLTCKAVSTEDVSLTVRSNAQTLYFNKNDANRTDLKISISNVKVYDGNNTEQNETVTIYDAELNVVYSGKKADFAATPWVIDTKDANPNKKYTFTVSNLPTWSVNLKYTKEIV